MASISLVAAKELALSFDDGVNPAIMADAVQVNQCLLDQLALQQIQAIMYPSLAKTGSDEAGLALVAEWGKAGHRIGNHSAQHTNLNKAEVSLADYLDSMAKADERLKTMPVWVARYRFPYLKEGDTALKRDGVRAWLRSHGYQSGAVTIDASDWYYNQLFRRYTANGDDASLAKLKQAYVAHIVARADYYDALAHQTLGYSPKHVLLLHVNHINAAYLDAVVAALRQKSWRFIDSDTAYQDPVYAQELDVLPAGESLIWSMAQSQGVAGLRYPAEDAPYEHDHLIAYGLALTP